MPPSQRLSKTLKIKLYNTMNQETITRETAMYEQIAKLQGSSHESIHILETAHGKETLTVSAETDYEDTFGRGGDYYKRPYVYQVRTSASLPAPVADRFNAKRFETAIEAYEWGRYIVLFAADKTSELLAALGDDKVKPASK